MNRQGNIRFLYNAFLRDKYQFTEKDIATLIQYVRKAIDKEQDKDTIEYNLDLLEKLQDIIIDKRF
jgi:hypothetical protein